MRIAPALGSMSRLTIRRRVVFPEPEVPTSMQMAPGGTSNVTPSTAGRPAPGYRFVTSRNAMVAIPPNRPSGVRIGHVAQGVVWWVVGCGSELPSKYTGLEFPLQKLPLRRVTRRRRLRHGRGRAGGGGAAGWGDRRHRSVGDH